MIVGEVPDSLCNFLMIPCRQTVVVLYIAFSIYHAVFVVTRVNEIHSLLSPPQLETVDELQNIFTPTEKSRK